MAFGMRVGVRINDENVKKLNAVLGKLGGGEFAVASMQTAVRETAKFAAKTLGEAAQQRYVTEVDESDIEIKTRGASSVLTVEGPMTDLQQHRVSSMAVSNGHQPASYQAQVLNASGMKTLTKYGNKVFAVRFKSGHLGFVVRRPEGETAKKYAAKPWLAKRRTGKGEVLESVYSLPRPEMFGNKYIYEAHEEEISDELNRRISAELDKAL